MIKSKCVKIVVLILIAIFQFETVFPCSMYKITVDGKTMVGNNEDSWGQDSKIWFVPRTEDKFGMVCVGYARKHPNPDGAMNEYGLVFDAFTMYRKPNIPEKDPNKKDFAYSHVLKIMQQCKTVDEVHAYLDQLNLHILNGSPIFYGGMLFFADKNGKYLIVEADKMTLGNDAKYVLANFSVADTKDLSTIKMERYCKGVSYLSNKELDTSLAFCAALSDTMSVNRPKAGDGTLYTSIYDLDEGLVHLNFFHDYSKSLSFDLQEELAKGPHSYSFTELFPDNKNYERFINYKIPQNSKPIFIFLLGCGFLFFVTSVFYFFNFFRSSNRSYRYLKLGMSGLSFALLVYTYVLLRNQGVYYFPSPYYDGSLIVSLTSYLPIVLLLITIPLIFILIKIIRLKKWGGFAKWLLGLNSLAYLVLLGFFTYWKLFGIF